ncbi:sulfate ABC transporter ATP-binding protein [Pandoraea apista]|uniref:Sulfate ABC transporter ATP-binding protein n=1 Tax=Pandoraea apista TaxID=93218 RepID=A0ABX9ZRE3_9BURK|nr:sulfate ABC transporter ATP-binding protein [Pandoraea apista]AJE99701.1 sulfate ABC transporter ATP-binding protein [Pandoraea apista]AKH73828.1 sulfate ABC transporter ATP-binding protein [Pandoraea apista]AKI62376.1 sulfate ABC transporter ATP-binding protein [Pandoraea apista]PTE01701.1 sulfate ABC transporter ATP-binding protein [Pandoraea apista]RRJ26407.1 sulfate ABC transporter ATP-binding protein [Pandoraea apista]
MSIQVQQVSKHFGDFAALDDVSLEFPTGELVALLGPSGCGKTTLLRIVAGLEFADAGRVVLNGEDVASVGTRERQVGFVFQHYALFRHMTVFENVAFGLRVKSRRERLSDAQIRTKVHELLGLVQLDWLADHYPAELSGGQRQRIALARALAVEPKVLLLDEPFGALDAKVRKELRSWLRRLHDELHITTIFVTHDQEEALEVADRIVLMNRGKVEQIGAPQDVYDTPESAFVYEFLGAANRLSGELRTHDFIADAGAYRVTVHKDDLPAVPQDGRAIAYVRPHDLALLPAHDSGPGINVAVRRAIPLGGTVRVELAAPGDAVWEAELTRSGWQALGADAGATLRAVPRQLRVFSAQA